MECQLGFGGLTARGCIEITPERALPLSVCMFSGAKEMHIG